MRTSRHLWCAALLLGLILAAGCTTSSPATPPATQAATSSQPAVPQNTPAATRAADIDTFVTVHYNDFTCLDVQKELGKTYLYPDEKFRLSAAPPSVSGVNVNVLFVDENDQLGLRQIKPQWDQVKKTWVYEGIVPLALFNDITTPVEKTFTIKTQSKYYICVDDRKETGINDAMLRVPIKLQRV